MNPEVLLKREHLIVMNLGDATPYKIEHLGWMGTYNADPTSGDPKPTYTLVEVVEAFYRIEEAQFTRIELRGRTTHDAKYPEARPAQVLYLQGRVCEQLLAIEMNQSNRFNNKPQGLGYD